MEGNNNFKYKSKLQDSKKHSHYPYYWRKSYKNNTAEDIHNIRNEEEEFNGNQPRNVTGPSQQLPYAPEICMNFRQGINEIPSHNGMPMLSQLSVDNNFAIPTRDVKISPNICATSSLNGTKMYPTTNSRSAPFEHDLGSWLSLSYLKEEPCFTIQEKCPQFPDNQNKGNYLYNVSGPSGQMAAETLSSQSVIQLPIDPPHRRNVLMDYVNYKQNDVMPSQSQIDNNSAISASNVMINSNICTSPVLNKMDMNPIHSSGKLRMSNDSNNFEIVPEEKYFPQQCNIMPRTNPIVLTNAILIPSLPEEKSYIRKPDGCRTVYVGNLPEKITRDIIEEAFRRFGDISAIRMNNKFCHVRFQDMESVEQALLLTGYILKIDDKSESANCSKIIVDYALDFECKKQNIEYAKDVCHRDPSPLPCYSQYQADYLNDKLRNAETFKEGIQVLLAWLKKGECTKDSTGKFHSMLHNVYSQGKRIINEKALFDEEFEKFKEKSKVLNSYIPFILSKIEEVYTAAEIQRNWDLFSKKQRKNIEDWKKEIMDFSAALITTREEVDMDLDLSVGNTEDHSGKDQYDTREIYILRKELHDLQQELEWFKWNFRMQSNQR
ncbi:ecto-NOX disulfide-thiol exchanger 1 [Trichonephila inaurata madagascariensis]|uniref:Ecto-NOX disulfide-thiol exchanger 1 n=1 Tax=Trichonephila inaurata madagascariensis TaxID=2747483 RepID=A0A8X7C898_9ARAC|nr:ecto-NOX disulfide-thiol exchanger 1 [Trichonephila inaurata madagascariensis]